MLKHPTPPCPLPPGRYQFYKGTVTRAICTKAETGYIVAAAGRACWCAPGYYYINTTACGVCGANSYCPGSKSTMASATRTSCGSNMVTSGNYAMSVKECVTSPGYGWAASGATICPSGTYNPGYNTRACSKCPAGLTTTSTGKTSTQDCVAPPGYYYLRGAAVACAQGTFKVAAGNADCTKCPLGFTTQPGTVAAKLASACTCEWGRGARVSAQQGGRLCSPQHNSLSADMPGLAPLPCLVGAELEPHYAQAVCPHLPASRAPPLPTHHPFRADLLPGYGAASGATLGTTDAVACVADKYRNGTVLYSTGAATNCIDCNTGMKTLEGVTGATSSDACLVPPGYGWVAVSQTATICAVGSYNPGWNRQTCSSCDGSTGTITTAAQGSNSSDDCVIPAGNGARSLGGGAFTGFACPADTYGRPNATTGLVEVAWCVPCAWPPARYIASADAPLLFVQCPVLSTGHLRKLPPSLAHSTAPSIPFHPTATSAWSTPAPGPPPAAWTPAPA